MSAARATPQQIIEMIDKAFPGAAKGKDDWYADSSRAHVVRPILTLLAELDPDLLPQDGDDFVAYTSARDAMQHAVDRWASGDNYYELRFTAGPIKGNPLTVMRRILVTAEERRTRPSAGQPQPHAIEGYTIVRPIDGGGFGEVFLCTDDRAGAREVAVKVLDPSALAPETDPDRRFLREAEALYKLKHRAIVTYHGFGHTGGERPLPYLVMDFVDGDELRIAATKMDVAGKVHAVIQTLDGLAHAHANGVLHRDIKPSNVLVRASDSQVVIVDFGLAYVWDGLSKESVTTHHPGTMGYIPPEVIADFKHRSVTHDIYSAGIVLYELIAGRHPNLQSYSSLADVDAALAGLDRLILRATDEENKRYTDATSFRDDLREWQLRYDKTLALGPSPLAEKIRRKFVDKRAAAAAERESRQAEAEEQGRLWRDLDSTIMAAARGAFDEMAAILEDLEYDYERQPEAREVVPSDEPSFVISLLRKKPHHEVHFGVACNHAKPLGRFGAPGMVIDWPKPAPGAPRSPKRELMFPFWIIFTSSQNQSPQKRLFGAIVACKEGGETILYGAPRGRHGFRMPGEPPRKLETPEEIRDHILEALAAVFDLELD